MLMSCMVVFQVPPEAIWAITVSPDDTVTASPHAAKSNRNKTIRNFMSDCIARQMPEQGEAAAVMERTITHACRHGFALSGSSALCSFYCFVFSSGSRFRLFTQDGG